MRYLFIKQKSNMNKFLCASLIVISSSLLITSCSKETDVPVSQTTILEVATEHNLIPSSSNLPLESGIAGRGKPIKQVTPTPTPTPTPEPTPTPTPSGVVACLYFDFDGETVSHPQWNNGISFYCQPSPMTAAARADAIYRVQLAYANYNVAVTDQLSVYNAAAVKQRIIVTPTSGWYASGSGVAGIGSLYSSSPAPAFVFSDRLFENTKYIGDIMMHESGHTIGLRHQSQYSSTCQLLNAYRPSTIMGSPFDMALAPWVYGTSTSCTTFQDDHTILAQNLGLR